MGALENKKKEIPEKLVSDMAGWLECGMVCYLNPDTLEMVTMLGPSYPNAYDLGFEDEDSLEKETLKRVDQWEHVVSIEPPESWESFRIMEDFVAFVLPEGSEIQKELAGALEKRRPFAHFKAVVECSEWREQWFEFRHKRFMELVRNQLPAYFLDDYLEII